MKQYLCFLTHNVFHSFSSKEYESFNFMTAVTVHSDFGAQASGRLYFLRVLVGETKVRGIK